MGLCARAAGQGKQVLICQFLKDNSSGERAVLGADPHITFLKGPEEVRFSFQMSAQERQQALRFYNGLLQQALERAAHGDCDVLFLDEALYAIRAGLLDEGPLAEFLRAKPAALEVILTGQDPSEQLAALADYISEICKRRHPYDHGIPARRGIEF